MQDAIPGKIKTSQTHPILASQYTAEVENDRKMIDYFRTKISFIESLDDVILQTIKAIFASEKLLAILKSRIVQMKYLVGERKEQYPHSLFCKKWLVVSLWPTRNVNCKCTFFKSLKNPDDVFLYQEDSGGHELQRSYNINYLVRDCRTAPILWLSDRIGKYKEEK